VAVDKMYRIKRFSNRQPIEWTPLSEIGYGVGIMRPGPTGDSLASNSTMFKPITVALIHAENLAVVVVVGL